MFDGTIEGAPDITKVDNIIYQMVKLMVDKQVRLIVDLMLHLKVHLRFYFKEQLKMHRKLVERRYLTLLLMVHLRVHSSV